MIAISFSDYKNYGCPYCGCDFATSGNFSGYGTATGRCEECGKEFVLLADGVEKSRIGFNNGEDIFEYPERQEHPRNGIPAHKYECPDPRPEYGEYWQSRGIGYDLSGFVKSKKAGERLLEMVKEVLGKEKPETWLDYREFEPKWIQFKFQSSEFDLDKLDKMACKNKDILTKEILIECKK